MRKTFPGASLHEILVYKRLDLDLVRGDGVFVEDTTGRRFLDLYGGHAVAILGYGHPALLAALSGQAAAMFFQTNLVDMPVRRAAFESLGRIAPPGLDRAFLVNSGAEADENALRITLRQRGILAGGAADPHVVRLMPPLVLQEAHVDLLAQALTDIGAA